MGKYQFVQAPQYIETLTCGMYHEANTYEVIETNTQKIAYRVEEESSILFRCACLLNCPPSNRPYESRIYNTGGELVATCSRPCKCSYLCICRPEVIVKDPTGAPLGRIVNPCPAFLCCNMKVSVQNEQDFDEYHLSLCVCNFHACCECCAGPCAETDITITPGEGMDSSQAPISLKKFWSGFAKECYSAANEYEFDVPDIWNDGQWVKFIAALQLFDMLFFEQYFQCFALVNINCKCMTC